MVWAAGLTAMTSATITVSRVATPAGRWPSSARDPLKVSVRTRRLAGTALLELERQPVVEVDGHGVADVQLWQVAHLFAGDDDERAAVRAPQRHVARGHVDGGDGRGDRHHARRGRGAGPGGDQPTPGRLREYGNSDGRGDKGGGKRGEYFVLSVHLGSLW